MQMLFPIEMRLQLKPGINNTTIIDDSYSSDFQSLKIALGITFWIQVILLIFPSLQKLIL